MTTNNKIFWSLLLFVLFFNLKVNAKDEPDVWTNIGPKGGNFSKLTFGLDNTAYVLVDQSILKSTDSGESWQEIGANNFKFNHFSVHSERPETLFASAQLTDSSLIKSTDSGLTWYEIPVNGRTDPATPYFSLPSPLIGRADADSFFSFNKPLTQTQQFLYYKDNKTKIAKSEDGGEHWLFTDTFISNPLNIDPLAYFTVLDPPAHFTIVKVDPFNSKIIYGQSSKFGRYGAGFVLYKSVDSGLSWENTFISEDITYRGHFMIDQNDSNKLYSKTKNARASSPFPLWISGWAISNNQGRNWERLVPPTDVNKVIIQLQLDPTDSNILYATLGHSAGNGYSSTIAKSINSGKNWQIIDISPFITKGHLSGPTDFAVNPENNQKTLMIVNNEIIKSHNGGQDWSLSKTGFRHIGGQFTVGESNSDVMFINGQKGNNYKTTNAGEQWELTKAECDQFIINPKNSQEILCYRIQSLFRSDDNGEHLILIKSDIQDGNILYASDGQTIFVSENGYKNKKISKSIDNGKTWNQISTLGGRITTHPSNPSILYTLVYSSSVDNSLTLYKSTDSGQNWQAIYNTITLGVHSLIINPSNPRQLLLIITQGNSGVIISENGGNTWKTLELGRFNGSYSSLVFDPKNTDGLYISLGNTVYKSHDMGSTWKLIKSNDPNSSETLKLQISSDNVYATSSSRIYKFTGSPDFNQTSKCLFEWAEKQYPSIFSSPIPAETILWKDYIYRYYSDTNTYLGFYQEKAIHLLQQNISPLINEVGIVENYQNIAGCD